MTGSPGTLLTGELELHGRIMPASNATFIGAVDGLRVVYKPIAGERPLWDFPDGTLAAREVAAYLVSEALGWDVVPPTFLRDGPHGPGMVQVWQDAEEDATPVDVVPAGRVTPPWRHVFDGVDAHDQPVSLVHEDTPALRRMAVFDVVVNNADRKGGHVLAMPGGHRYGVDHGLTFHAEPKLRTVLWGWLGEPVAEGDLADLAALDVSAALAVHLAEEEVEAFERRCDELLDTGLMPAPHGGSPAIPWPPF